MNGAYVIETLINSMLFHESKIHHFDQNGGLSFFENVCFYVMYIFFGV